MVRKFINFSKFEYFTTRQSLKLNQYNLIEISQTIKKADIDANYANTEPIKHNRLLSKTKSNIYVVQNHTRCV